MKVKYIRFFTDGQPELGDTGVLCLDARCNYNTGELQAIARARIKQLRHISKCQKANGISTSLCIRDLPDKPTIHL